MRVSRPALLAALVFVALTILHTYPLSIAPASRSLNHNVDTEQAEWTLSWIAHALRTDPRHLFDGNIFWPERHTLAYSDPVIMPAMFALPVRLLGGSPVLAFNIAVLVGLALTGWAAWFVAWRWTGSATAALTAGALAAFNVHLLTRLPHIVAAQSWTLPLTFYLADRVATERRPRDAVALALCVTATAANSLYWLALAGLIVGVTMVVHARQWRGALMTGGAAVAGLVIALPVLWPYLELAKAGATRPLESIVQFSATPAGYLASTTRIDRGWTARFYTHDVDVFFAGVAALVLAVIGAIAAWRTRGSRARMTILALVGAIGVILSFGPASTIYRWAYVWFEPIRGLRAVARFGYLYLLGVAFAAGYGVAAIERRVSRAGTGAGPYIPHVGRNVIGRLLDDDLGTGAGPDIQPVGAASPDTHNVPAALRPDTHDVVAAPHDRAEVPSVGAAPRGRPNVRRRAKGWTAGLALAAVTIEAWSAPILTLPFTGIPPIYELVAAAPDPVRLVELPFYPPDGMPGNGEYELNATAHWKPIMNGTSGATPDSYRQHAASFWFFPRDWAIDAIEQAGATHVMVHLEHFTPSEVADIELALRHRPELWLIGADSRGHRLYRVVKAR
ncbi:MAG TPA: hypothetical protein VG538_12340 [Vicinamibacterales bacterium]|nr:hypothetical protein [Vicinamibacterales bacterium]